MKKLIFISILLLSITSNAQQIPLQSQYMFNGVALNPAYTGSEDALSIVGTFRAQWIGFPGAPTTQALTVHTPFKKMKAAAGVQVYADQIGITRRTGVFGSYAYNLRFPSSTLTFGVSGGVNFLQSYFSRLQGNDQVDNEIAQDSPLGIMPNFSLGLHYFSKKYFVSFSLPQFLTHDFDGLKYKLRNDFSNYNVMFGGGVLFNVGQNTELKPSILSKYRSDSPMQFDFNLMAAFDQKIEVGLSYRTQEALVALFKVKARDHFSIMYSFGFPLSPIYRYTYGSHELSVKYNFYYKTPITSPRFLGF